MHETLKDALQRGQFKDAYIQISHLTADLYINALHRSERQPAGDRAEALSHRLQGSNGLGKDTPPARSLRRGRAHWPAQVAQT